VRKALNVVDLDRPNIRVHHRGSLARPPKPHGSLLRKGVFAPSLSLSKSINNQIVGDLLRFKLALVLGQYVSMSQNPPVMKKRR
jgi:hypothetical protein